jgi:YVTN family beta-propeller protein
VKVIPVGQYPLILAMSPDGRYVYSANRNSNSVSVIRTGLDTVVATVQNVGPQPHGIDITADGRFAYVSCENVTAAVPPHHPTSGSKVPGFVAVVDLATNQVVKTIEVGAFAAGVAVVQ